jgi:hypothetical protein
MTELGCVSSGTISASNWTHVSVSVDTFNNKVKIYLNGVLDSTHDYFIANQDITLTDTITIGKDTADNYFSGSLYQTNLYYGAFSAEKVASLSYDVSLVCGFSLDEIKTNEDDGSKYFKDISTNELQAVSQGTHTLSYPGIIEFNKSADFTPNNYLTVALNNSHLENLSASMWVHKNDASVLSGTLVHLDDRLSIKVVSATQIIVNGTTVDLSSSLCYGEGEWSFLVVTLLQFYNASGALETTANVYVDGVLDSTVVINKASPVHNSTTLYIGYDNASTYLTGKMDHFMLHSGILSGSDITRFYNTFMAKKTYTGRHVIAGYWNHVAASFNKSTNTLTTFINGSKLQEYPGYQITPNNGQTNLLMGKTDTEYFDGGMDDLRIYNAALPEVDIRTIFDTKNPYILYQLEVTSPTIDNDAGTLTVSYSALSMDDVPKQYMGVFTTEFADASTDADLLALLVADTFSNATFSVTTTTSAGIISNSKAFTSAIDSATTESTPIDDSSNYTVKVFLTDSNGLDILTSIFATYTTAAGGGSLFDYTNTTRLDGLKAYSNTASDFTIDTNFDNIRFIDDFQSSMLRDNYYGYLHAQYYQVDVTLRPGSMGGDFANIQEIFLNHRRSHAIMKGGKYIYCLPNSRNDAKSAGITNAISDVRTAQALVLADKFTDFLIENDDLYAVKLFTGTGYTVISCTNGEIYGLGKSSINHDPGNGFKTVDHLTNPPIVKAEGKLFNTGVAWTNPTNGLVVSSGIIDWNAYVAPGGALEGYEMKFHTPADYAICLVCEHKDTGHQVIFHCAMRNNHFSGLIQLMYEADSSYSTMTRKILQMHYITNHITFIQVEEVSTGNKQWWVYGQNWQDWGYYGPSYIPSTSNPGQVSAQTYHRLDLIEDILNSYDNIDLFWTNLNTLGYITHENGVSTLYECTSSTNLQVLIKEFDHATYGVVRPHLNNDYLISLPGTTF